MSGRRHKREENQRLQYGIAILLLLFIVVGLTKGLETDKTVETTDRLQSADYSENDKKTADASKNNIKERKEPDVKNPQIRVLIMTDGYVNDTHSEVKLTSDTGLIVTVGDKRKEYKKKTLSLAPDHKWFDDGKIRVRAKKGKIKLLSVKRGIGNPEYAGTIELQTSAEGIIMINELPVESYLCGVVPSEMPSSYEQEALKVQAVCARSYAYRQMENYAYPEYKVHVNDSTDYQVYNNSGYAKSTTRAVHDTEGETVKYHGKIVATYYFSTSGGRTTTMEA